MLTPSPNDRPLNPEIGVDLDSQRQRIHTNKGKGKKKKKGRGQPRGIDLSNPIENRVNPSSLTIDVRKVAQVNANNADGLEVADISNEQENNAFKRDEKQ